MKYGNIKTTKIIIAIAIVCITACGTNLKSRINGAFSKANLRETDLYKNLKGVALCSCISKVNKSIDSTSTINRDYSASYFVQIADVDLRHIIKVLSYTDTAVHKFWGIPQDMTGNMNAYTCWKFYESSELDGFIVKILNEDQYELE